MLYVVYGLYMNKFISSIYQKAIHRQGHAHYDLLVCIRCLRSLIPC